MEHIYFDSFNMAGGNYYELPIVFQKLKIGKKLRLVSEPDNRYDEFAVAIYFKDHKIGFVPRNSNRKLALLLKAGVDVFDARVQSIHPEEHPANQLDVVLYILTPNSQP